MVGSLLIVHMEMSSFHKIKALIIDKVANNASVFLVHKAEIINPLPNANFVTSKYI